MPNSPIQVVLNSGNFLTNRDIRPGGGLNKEFFENDAEFVNHKASVIKNLSDLSQNLAKNEFSDIGYAKLILKRSGLAKSHRPSRALLKDTPIVGAGDIGELYIEVTQDSVSKIIEKANESEDAVKYKDIKNKDEPVPAPSRVRSEIGAIDRIEPYTSGDKRSFSVEQGFKWLSDSRTGGSYMVELFEIPPVMSEWKSLSPEKSKLFQSFVDGIKALGQGVAAQRLIDTPGGYPMMNVRITQSLNAPDVQLLASSANAPKKGSLIDNRIERHSRLIDFLDKHPLVKKIHLPPIIKRSNLLRKRPALDQAIIPSPIKNKSYPKVAVIDGGVSNVLKSWIVDSWDFLSPTHRGEDHGTFIAGLVVAGNQFNGTEICPELDGCHIVDLDIFPDDSNFSEYFNGVSGFMDELASAVKVLKERTGVKIFNFSMNVEQAVETNTYHPVAQKLDQIANENNVIFVISAGNTNKDDQRGEWSDSPVQALSTLAVARNDGIKVPAESVRNISVAALNPTGMGKIISHAPASYSCRGPGVRVGIKPDFAHIGGSGVAHEDLGYGLFSISPSGKIIDNCGTSFATPIVAKMLASLDHAIEGEVSRETLSALAIHHAQLPEVLKAKEFDNVVRHLVGFGMPSHTEEVLNGGDNQITLVFSATLKKDKAMRFNFTWPNSLVKNGKCVGAAKLTLVSNPPLDYRHGVEFVRVNLDAHLKQEKPDGKFSSKLEPIYLPEEKSHGLSESGLIDYSLKWSPIKAYYKAFKRGVGTSTNWRIDINYLLRDKEEMPDEGVDFTAILTISDPEKEALVFNDMRQTLSAIGVEVADIKTAARVLTRI